MSNRRRKRQATTTAPETDHYEETTVADTSPRAGNSAPGMGGLFLSRNSADAIDALNPALNRWAMLFLILQGFKIGMRRPFASLACLLLSFGGLSLALGVVKASVLVAAGKAAPVNSRDITDPTSANQVGMWLGSQVGAPALQSGTAALVGWSSDSATGGQAQNVSAPAATQWAGGGAIEVSDRSTPTGGKIQLIQGRR